MNAYSLLFYLILSLSSISLSSKASDLVFSFSSFCYESPRTKKINSIYFMDNQAQPVNDENLCIYKDNSQYHSQGSVVNGLRHGEWTFWYVNGIKKSIVNYKAGNYDGKYFFMSENGRLLIEGSYKENQKNGIWKYWNHMGIKIKEESYNFDMKDGKFIVWDAEGNMLSERNYLNNELNGKSIYWHRNSHKFAEGIYKNGKSDGEWTFWSTNGKKIETKSYNEGELIKQIIF